jgi:predicted N-formylglutamate amidohydrolase
MDGSLPFNPAAANLDEPALFDIRRGNGPVLFLFQHSGYTVPNNLHDAKGLPLGLPKERYDPKSREHRHEAADWGTLSFAEILARLIPDATLVISLVSREVADLDRARNAKNVIPTFSSEHPDHKVPGNTGLSEEEVEERLVKFYDPYHQAVAKEMARIKRKYGYVRVIDIHSFTQNWRGTERDVEIGTLYTTEKENPLAHAINNALTKQTKYIFKPNAPYQLSKLPENGAHVFENTHGEKRVGIELSQKILSTPEGIEQTAFIISDAIYDAISDLAPTPQTQHRVEREAVYA